MSTLSAPQVNALAGLSIRELLQELTRLQNMVSVPPPAGTGPHQAGSPAAAR